MVIEVLFSLIGRKARTPGRLGCSHGARSLHARHRMKRIRSSSGCNLIGYTVLMYSDGATGNDCATLKSNVPGCSLRFVGSFINPLNLIDFTAQSLSIRNGKEQKAK